MEALDAFLTLDVPTPLLQRRHVTAPREPEASAETAWVEAARRGDLGAFDRLYGRYARMVHGILLARAPRGEVEDLVQEVFLAVFRRLRTLRDPAAFGGWIAMIARNRAVDSHRRSPRTEELPEDLEGGDPSEAQAREILDIVRGLPEAYRETLLMRLAEGMTGPEIAERTGLTPGSVRVNLHRGMALLRDRLKERTREDPS